MRIDMDAAEPPYRQLARWLRDQIAAGTWGPGQRIPSITWLAEQSGLSAFTVKKALTALKAEGAVYGVPGRGTYVSPPR